jgi:hypothetical protein
MIPCDSLKTHPQFACLKPAIFEYEDPDGRIYHYCAEHYDEWMKLHNQWKITGMTYTAFMDDHVNKILREAGIE